MKKTSLALLLLLTTVVLGSPVIAGAAAAAADPVPDRCAVVTVVRTDCSCKGAFDQYVPTLEVLTSDGIFTASPLNEESDLPGCQAFISQSAMCK